MKRCGCFLTKHSLRNMNQLRMIQGSAGKISSYTGGTETVLPNRCSYQVSVMVGTNDYTNENHKFYKSTVQAISRGGGYCDTKVVSLCDHFFDMVSLVKSQA